jgi:hypothetical protein
MNHFPSFPALGPEMISGNTQSNIFINSREENENEKY